MRFQMSARVWLIVLLNVAVLSSLAQPTVEELVARAGKGPSLLFTREMVPGIRARIAGDADAAKWWRKHLLGLDARLEDAVTVPDRGGQWVLWMVCKTCGSTIKSVGPTRHICSKCGAAYSGWPYDDCFVSTLHRGNARDVRDCGIAWLLGAGDKYADRAKEILLGYAAAYPRYGWHGRNGPGTRGTGSCARMMAQVLDEAVLLTSFLEGYDAVRDRLTPEERARIEGDFLRPSVDVTRSECSKWSNHEVWHLSAWGRAGLVLGDARLVDEAINGPYGALRQLAHGILPDGLWYEGALHYHYYTMAAFTPFFRSLRNLGYEVPEAYRRMFLAPFGQLAPDGQLPPVNDSWQTWLRPGDRAAEYEMAYSWWNDATCGWWVSQKPRATAEYALWGRSASGRSLSAPPALTSCLYRESGLAVLRAQTPGTKRKGIVPDNCLMMDFGPHGEWHGHPDKLNVFFWLHGRMVSGDPGCIGYGSSRHWGWYKSSLAHNTVRVDGRNQRPSTGELIAFAANADASIVAARLRGDRPRKGRWDGPANEGVDELRATALAGDMVFDYHEVSSAAEHDYEWCFHARGDFAAPGLAFQPMENLPPRFKLKKYGGQTILPGDDSWSWVENPAHAPHAGAWQATWAQPGFTLAVWQRASAAGELETGVGGAQPPPAKMALAVNKVHGRRASFATVMTANPRAEVKFGETIADADGTCGFAVEIDGRRYELLVNPRADACRGRKGAAQLRM